MITFSFTRAAHRHSLGDALRQLAHQADLSELPDLDSDNPQARDLRQFLEQLHNCLEKGLQASISIAAQAPHMASASAQAQTNGHTLRDSASQIASASEEISTTVNGEMTDATNAMHQLAQQASSEVSDCDQQGAQLRTEMADIRDEVSALQTSIQDVDQQASEMERILGMISDISNQTNLLALNAAIEAARAGDAGRGFSVVAEEVRALAHRTMEATGEVEQRIGRVRQQAAALSANGNTVSARVESGWTHIQVMREVLSGTAERMQELEAHSQQVATATAQIGSAVANVSEDIQGIAEVSHQLLETGEQLRGGSLAMREDGDRLLEALGGFRLRLHQQARQAVSTLAAELMDGAELSVPRAEQVLEKALTNQDGRYELLYLTDPTGLQISRNIHPDWVEVRYQGTGEGRDWSGRDWYRAAHDTGQPYTTSVYRSAATDEYCLTISAPVRSPEGQLVAVLGADIRLRALLDS